MNTGKSYLRYSHDISRRSFLKLSALGVAGVFMPPYGKLPDEPHFERVAQTWVIGAGSQWEPLAQTSSLDAAQQGRVLDPFIILYDRPSEDGKKIKNLWKDAVFPITGVTFQEDTPSHNKVWYRVGEDGYVHSGAVQPVKTALNEPNPAIPEGGILAEVTVPFTDAYWNPGKNQLVAYRFYYETTHWVVRLLYDDDGDPWYAVLDDKWDLIFYVPASHLRFIPDSELEPLSPALPSSLKRLEVRLAEQLLVAYEIDRPVFMARVATGAKFRDGDFSTKPGWYSTFHKRSSRHMAAGNLAANGYDLPGVPWISYFTESGISFHGTFWHNNFGRPRSHGCVNLAPQAAKWVYRWTIPVVPPEQKMVYEDMGTLVHVLQDSEA